MAELRHCAFKADLINITILKIHLMFIYDVEGITRSNKTKENHQQTLQFPSSMEHFSVLQPIVLV